MNMTEPGNVIDFPQPKNLVCAVCGGSRVASKVEEEAFVYGAGKDQVTLTVRVPVRSCGDCGSSYTDVAAEEARHSATCEHLGVMPPCQVETIRATHGMSRAEFAGFTGIGESSLARWENGANIQNRAMDNYLRLLMFPENLTRVRRKAEPRAKNGPVFRVFHPTTIEEADAQSFQLRPISCTS
jgi:putative zinc finger/helix-turn-helix YgiT family protein